MTKLRRREAEAGSDVGAIALAPGFLHCDQPLEQLGVGAMPASR